jgi:hypothetical protein
MKVPCSFYSSALCYILNPDCVVLLVLFFLLKVALVALSLFGSVRILGLLFLFESITTLDTNFIDDTVALVFVGELIPQFCTNMKICRFLSPLYKMAQYLW